MLSYAVEHDCAFIIHRDGEVPRSGHWSDGLYLRYRKPARAETIWLAAEGIACNPWLRTGCTNQRVCTGCSMRNTLATCSFEDARRINEYRSRMSEFSVPGFAIPDLLPEYITAFGVCSLGEPLYG